jgi:hypothetical protein
MQKETGSLEKFLSGLPEIKNKQRILRRLQEIPLEPIEKSLFTYSNHTPSPKHKIHIKPSSFRIMNKSESKISQRKITNLSLSPIGIYEKVREEIL